MAKQVRTEEAQNGRREVQRLISTVTRNMNNISEANRERALNLLGRGGQFLDRVDNIQVANLSAYDMLGGAYRVGAVVVSGGSTEQIGEAVLENTVGRVIDKFLKDHAKYEGELFSFDQQVSTPVFTGVNADLGFNAEVKTELNVKREGASISGKASLNALARLRVGISFGFNAPGLGSLSVGGGLQGGPNLDAETSITLAISGANLTGRFNATPLKVSLNTELYFSLPSVIPDDVIEWVAEKLDLESSSNRILYPLGTIDVITATTPGYTITFDMRRGAFTDARATGSWRFELNQRIKDFVQRLKNALSEAFDAVRRAAASAVGAVVDGAQAAGQAVVDGAQAVGNAVSNAANVVANTVSSVANTATNTARRVVRSTRQAVQQTVQTVSNAANRIADSGRQAVNTVVETGRQAVQTVQNAASQLVDQGRHAVESLTETGRQALSTAREAASSVLNTGRNLANEVGNAVSEGASQAYSAISSGARSVLSSLNPFD